MSGDALLKKWYDLKQSIKKLETEEETIRNKVRKVMEAKKLTEIKGGEYRVSYRDVSRETFSKKDCPLEIWSKYARKITYPVIKVMHISGENDEDPVEFK